MGILENSEIIIEWIMLGKVGVDLIRRKKFKRVVFLKNSDKDYGLGLVGNVFVFLNSEM